MDTLEKSVTDLKEDFDSFRNQVVIYENKLNPVNEQEFNDLKKR